MREEFVSDKVNFKVFFEQIGTTELWSELARRMNIRFGKIQMAIHNGKPSKFAQIDIQVSTETEANLFAK